MTLPRTYQQAAEFLAGGRSKDERPVANNTRVVRRQHDYIAVRLHETDIAVFAPDGYSVALFTGGWHTVTTKERLNQIIPGRIYSHRGQWFYSGVPFYEGMRVNYNTGVIIESEQERESSAALMQENERRIKAIEKYLRLWTPERVVSAVSDMSGDCWYCLMVVRDGAHAGQTLGEASGDTEHLLSHMEEGYTPGSLLIRALRSAFWTEFRMQLMFDNFRNGRADKWDRTGLRRALRNYLRTELVSTDTRARRVSNSVHW